MIGAVIGDVVGSAYEHQPIKGYTLPLTPASATVTDDSVLIAAVSDAIRHHLPFEDRLRHWGHRYRDIGFGPGFDNWLADDLLGPYGSTGNGAAVRAIAIGFLCAEGDLDAAVFEATDCTHDTGEAHLGAAAIARSINALTRGLPAEDVLLRALSLYGLKAPLDLDRLHREHAFDATCDVTVPIALSVALQARNFKDAMAKGLYIGGDTDSILAMTGALRQAMRPEDIPDDLRSFAIQQLRRRAPDIESHLLCIS